jgi:hypothetical protein
MVTTGTFYNQNHQRHGLECSPENTSFTYHFVSRQHHANGVRFEGNDDILLLYGRRIGVSLTTSGGKHGGKLTIEFFDRDNKAIAYDQWLSTWSDDLDEALRILEKTVSTDAMERIWLRGENFGLELGMEQWDTKGRTASVTWGLFCVPYAGRGRMTPHDTCCSVYSLALDPVDSNRWNLAKVQKGKGR